MNKVTEINQPSSTYNCPKDIVLDIHLNFKQKKRALNNWKQMCIQLQESENEGMQGNNHTEDLSLVLKELISLKD